MGSLSIKYNQIPSLMYNCGRAVYKNGLLWYIS